MTGITAAIPYAFSALAQIKWRLADHRQLETPRFVRDVTVAVIALVFSALFIWYSRMTGEPFLKEFSPFIMAGVAFLIGIPVYLRQRTRMTEPRAGSGVRGLAQTDPGPARELRRTRIVSALLRTVAQYPLQPVTQKVLYLVSLPIELGAYTFSLTW